MMKTGMSSILNELIFLCTAALYRVFQFFCKYGTIADSNYADDGIFLMNVPYI